MSKRFEEFKEFGRSTKKPKLDIAMSKVLQQPVSTNCGRLQWPTETKRTKVAQCSPDNLWDDDDDDVIMLATQMAERQNSPTARMTTTIETQLTFSEFVPNLKATTSTQRLDKVNLEPSFSIPADVFNDDDDDEFAMFVRQADKQIAKELIVPLTEDPFKKPHPPIPSVQKENVNLPAVTFAFTPTQNEPTPSSSSTGQLSSSQSTARRQMASELQIKFLTERLNALKKENQKIMQELDDAKSTMERKDGEASLLRDELRGTKQQVQTLKMDKLLNVELVKGECQHKIDELSRQVAAKETELQMKSAEYSCLKMRRADESKYEHELQPSLQHDITLDMDTNVISQRRALVRLKALKLDEHHDEHLSCGRVPDEIFEPDPVMTGASKKWRTPFQLELEVIQMVIARLQLPAGTTTLPRTKEESLCERTIASVDKVFSEFWTYVHSLEFPRNCRIHPCHAYDLRKDQSAVGAGPQRSIHQVNVLHETERASTLRRYVAGLSVICGVLPSVGRALLTQRHGEYLLLQIAIDAINKLGFARQVCEHFGLLEAFAVLLRILMTTTRHGAAVMAEEGAAIDTQCSLLIALLKAIIFCRPSPWVFAPVSQCVLLCTRWPRALTELCVNSDQDSFVTDLTQSVHRFSMSSCLLQVYAGLLEVAFPAYTPLSPPHFRLLSVICENHARFVFHCFEHPPTFVYDQLSNCDDEDDDDQDHDQNQKLNREHNDDDGDDDGTSTIDIGTVETPLDDNEIDLFPPMNDIKEAGPPTLSVTATATISDAEKITDIKCECLIRLCLSLVTLLFQLMWQWRYASRNSPSETNRVAGISKVAVKLLYMIFCDNYATTRPFADAEETIRHYLYLICEWWSESSELLCFKDIHMETLMKLRNAHIMPKPLTEDGHLTAVAADLAEWHQITSDATVTTTEPTNATAVNNLKLMENAFEPSNFFQGLKGYAFNFE